jgi:hypothetical protein
MLPAAAHVRQNGWNRERGGTPGEGSHSGRSARKVNGTQMYRFKLIVGLGQARQNLRDQEISGITMEELLAQFCRSVYGTGKTPHTQVHFYCQRRVV